MKQKNSSKTGWLVFQPWRQFKSLLLKYPKVSVTVMLSVVAINVALMLIFSGDFKSVSYSFSNVRSQITDSSDRSDMGIPFSFENYRTMKAIQDTLSWLAGKEHRTTADTAVLLRLIDKIEKLDPLFFDKIKKATHGKDTTK
ncbi:hypothetical protein [Niabella hirudinis]|uniref:hypothetical protein n=1 Tax=Niabella hirudinis TaxID=1285929 RepID=UPI003EBBFFD4